MNNRRAINPFSNQNYFYPAPYLQVPMDEKSQAFRSNKYFYPLIYTPINFAPTGYRETDNGQEADGSIKLGTIVVLSGDDSELSDRKPKSVAELSKKVVADRKAAKLKGKPPQSDSLIDQIVNYVPDALGFSDEEEDERQELVISTPSLPAIKNDKYLNFAIKKHPQEIEDEAENRQLPPPMPSTANIRAFNFSNPIEKLQNFTKQFALTQREEVVKEPTIIPTVPSPEDVEEDDDEKADDKEDEKSPFGFAFGPQQQLETYKKGGLIIQRLKVRRGGIAIAGPGGVATVK